MKDGTLISLQSNMAREAIEGTLSCYALALLCAWAVHATLLASSTPALKSPESAMAKEATPEPLAISVTEAAPESAPFPVNGLPSAHYVSRATFGAVIYVVFPFLTLIQSCQNLIGLPCSSSLSCRSHSSLLFCQPHSSFLCGLYLWLRSGLLPGLLTH